MSVVRETIRVMALRTGMALTGAFMVLAASGGPVAQGASPGEIFTSDSSGMLQAKSICATGTYLGSGFLIGPRLMITALHVLEDVNGTGAACSTSVTQEGTGLKAHVL